MNFSKESLSRTETVIQWSLRIKDTLGPIYQVVCPLYRDCPLLRDSNCIILIGRLKFGDLVLSIVERDLIQCPLFRVSIKRDSTVCGKTLQRGRGMSEDTRGLKSCNRQNLSFRTFWSISFDNMR